MLYLSMYSSIPSYFFLFLLTGAAEDSALRDEEKAAEELFVNLVRHLNIYMYMYVCIYVCILDVCVFVYYIYTYTYIYIYMFIYI